MSHCRQTLTGHTAQQERKRLLHAQR